MKRHTNLMPPRASRAASLRKAISLYFWVSLGIAALLTIYTFHLHERVSTAKNRRLALEAQYAPIQSMKDQTRSYQKKIDELISREGVPLALSVNRPPLTLLHSISKAAADQRDELYVETLSYRTPGRLEEVSATGANRGILSVRGVAGSDHAVSTFAEGIRTQNLFQKTDLKSTVAGQLEGRSVKHFEIECHL